MKLTELKSKLDFYADAIYQKGYDLGFESILEELEQISDSWHNNGFTSPAEMLRLEIRKLRSEK
jgi:TPR repeat protein